MGSGIAQVAATAGCKVLVYDTNLPALEKSKQKLDKVLLRLIEKERIDAEEKLRIQGNISYIDELKGLSPCQLTIEAIVENLAVKQKVFAELETHVDDTTIIASNTSSLSIASIASALTRPERCMVIPAIQTSTTVLETAVEIISGWKKVIAVAKDTPGFIVNRVARPFYGEALRIHEEGLADFVTIDWSLKSLGDFRMGPFELMDFIGNDVNYTVTETVFKAFYYDPRYRPSFTQKRLSEAGYLGRKTGKGYYDYGEGATKPQPKEDQELAQTIFERVLVMLINEAADALFLNVASAEDIDNAMTKGVNYPKGLLKWADEKGIDWCVSQLDALYDTYHEDRYRCSPLLRKKLQEGTNFFQS